jgi:phosphoribosylformimino-5-aminoimidazole carboxamide ribotide isomerase
MKIVPVIDILDGRVVHAIKGERHTYKPLKSFLCKRSEPLELAKNFREEFGFKEIYIADLNSIMNRDSNFEKVKKIAASGFSIMLDAGVDCLDKARRALELGISKVVIGSETLSSKDELKKIVNKLGLDKVIVSIDYKDDKVLSKGSLSQNLFDVIKELNNIGIKEAILLYLSRVGTGLGVNLDEVRKAVKLSEFDLLIGGGIKGYDDLINLKEIGIKGVLIATALHNKKITKEHVSLLQKRANLFS